MPYLSSLLQNGTAVRGEGRRRRKCQAAGNGRIVAQVIRKLALPGASPLSKDGKGAVAGLVDLVVGLLESSNQRKDLAEANKWLCRFLSDCLSALCTPDRSARLEGLSEVELCVDEAKLLQVGRLRQQQEKIFDRIFETGGNNWNSARQWVADVTDFLTSPDLPRHLAHSRLLYGQRQADKVFLHHLPQHYAQTWRSTVWRMPSLMPPLRFRRCVRRKALVRSMGDFNPRLAASSQQQYMDILDESTDACVYNLSTGVLVECPAEALASLQADPDAKVLPVHEWLAGRPDRLEQEQFVHIPLTLAGVKTLGVLAPLGPAGADGQVKISIGAYKTLGTLTWAPDAAASASFRLDNFGEAVQALAAMGVFGPRHEEGLAAALSRLVPSGPALTCHLATERAAVALPASMHYADGLSGPIIGLETTLALDAWNLPRTDVALMFRSNGVSVHCQAWCGMMTSRSLDASERDGVDLLVPLPLLQNTRIKLRHLRISWEPCMLECFDAPFGFNGRDDILVAYASIRQHGFAIDLRLAGVFSLQALMGKLEFMREFPGGNLFTAHGGSGISFDSELGQVDVKGTLSFHLGWINTSPIHFVLSWSRCGGLAGAVHLNKANLKQFVNGLRQTVQHILPITLPQFLEALLPDSACLSFAGAELYLAVTGLKLAADKFPIGVQLRNLSVSLQP